MDSKAKSWGIALRAFAFPASIVPVLVGSAYAWLMAGGFNWGYFFLALIGGMLIHTACNMINDYFDYKHGLDHEGAYGGSGVLVSGALKPKELLTGAYLFLLVGCVIGAYFIYIFGMPMLYIGAAGVLATIFYTTTPFALKYVALGSPLVFIQMGPLMVLGAYLVQTGSLSWSAVWISLPVGFIVAGILHANDTRDIVHDRKAGIRTISTILGPTGSRAYLSFLLFAPYLTVILLPLLGVAPWTILLPLLTLPLAIGAHALHWKIRDVEHEALRDTPEMVAKLHMAFGVLLTIGLVAGNWIGS
jgi:1,4-dihydroxy-2-naphthoate octaprenyltransferase